MSQVSYLLTTVSAHCFSILTLTSSAVSIMTVQVLTGFASFLLLDWSISLIPTHLEMKHKKQH